MANLKKEHQSLYLKSDEENIEPANNVFPSANKEVVELMPEDAEPSQPNNIKQTSKKKKKTKFRPLGDFEAMRSSKDTFISRQIIKGHNPMSS